MAINSFIDKATISPERFDEAAKVVTEVWRQNEIYQLTNGN